MKNLKAFESFDELPEKVDISKYLDSIRKITIEMQEVEESSDEWDVLTAKKTQIESKIEGILIPIIEQFINKNDFDSPKDLISNSFEGLDNSVKDRLFKHVLKKEREYYFNTSK